jgi:hypothetical protein
MARRRNSLPATWAAARRSRLFRVRVGSSRSSTSAPAAGLLPAPARHPVPDPCPTLDAGLGSELHRLQHPITLGEPWIPIVGCSIGLSATYPTLFHAAMVGRARLADGPPGNGAAAPPAAAVSTGCDCHVA